MRSALLSLGFRFTGCWQPLLSSVASRRELGSGLYFSDREFNGAYCWFRDAEPLLRGRAALLFSTGAVLPFLFHAVRLPLPYCLLPQSVDYLNPWTC